MKKLKVVDKFVAVKALLNGEKADMSVADALTFLDERIAITEKKNASGSGERKPTATQIANEGVKVDILSFLATQTAPVPVKDIQKGVGIESNQKATALITQLVKAGKIMRTEVKGKAHFALAEQE